MPLSRSPLPRPQLLQGTLDLLLLSVLDTQPLHGYALARAVTQRSAGLLTIEEGSLYPALRRLAKQQFITGQWHQGLRGRRARTFRLTPAGRDHLRDERTLWTLFARGISNVLSSAGDHAAQPPYPDTVE